MSDKLKELLTSGALWSFELGQQEKFIEQTYTSGANELTELESVQSLISKLPLLLPMQTPPVTLKDTVARKLYRYSEEERAKRMEAEQIISQKTLPVKPEEKLVLPNEVREEIIPENDQSPIEKEEIIEETKEVASVTGDSLDFIKVEAEEIPEKVQPTVPEKIEGVTEPVVITKPAPLKDSGGVPLKNKLKEFSYTPYSEKLLQLNSRKKGGKLGWIIPLLIFIAAIVAIYFIYNHFTKKISVYEKEVDRLKKESVNTSIQSSDDSTVREILTSKDVAVVNLNGSEADRDGIGKLILSLDMNKAVFQYSNMPAMEPGKIFILWVTEEGKFYSMGIIDPSLRKTFYPVSFPALTFRNVVRFILTAETNQYAKSPEGLIYLEGTL
ncbi:MAG: hypothetical protein HXY49_04245 [Ignavibacteriaceae bacterium]|nr:hypothetical protein [Ignavibacteriaceae bacterium]